MGTLFWTLIGVVGGFGLIVGGTYSVRYFAKLIWWNSRTFLAERTIWDSDGYTRRHELIPTRRSFYDDSSYKRRDSPHADDYWWGLALTMVAPVSYLVWGVNRWHHHRRKVKTEHWKTAKEVREQEATERARLKAESEKIIDELSRPREDT